MIKARDLSSLGYAIAQGLLILLGILTALALIVGLGFGLMRGVSALEDATDGNYTDPQVGPVRLGTSTYKYCQGEALVIDGYKSMTSIPDHPECQP